MELFAIFFFCFLLIAYWYTIKKKGAGILALALVGLYTLSALTSIIVYEGRPERFSDVNVFSYIVLFLFLIISFLPIVHFRKEKYEGIRLLSESYSNIIAIALIILNIPVAIDIIPKAITSYQSMLLDFAIATELYGETAEMVKEQTGSSFENIAEVLRGISAGILIFYSFYYLACPFRKKILVVLLWVCVFLPIPASLLSASRTGLSYWVLEMFVAYCIFSPFMKQKNQKRLRAVMITFGVFLVLVFGALTIGRFGASEFKADNEVQNSVAEYFGQGTLHFSADVLQNDTYQWGDGTMPFFRQILGLSYSKNIYDRQAKWGNSMKIEQGAFYTYIGDLCCDFSPYLAFILVFIVSIIFNKGINQNNNSFMGTPRLFLLFFICSICYDGLFYFSFKTIGGNLKLIMNMLFFIFIQTRVVNSGQKIKYKI